MKNTFIPMPAFGQLSLGRCFGALAFSVVLGCTALTRIGIAAEAQAAPAPGHAAPAGSPQAAQSRRGGASAQLYQFSAQDEQAVEVAVHGYFRAFTDKDWAQLDQYLTAPFVEMGPRPRYLATFADVLSTWHRIRDPLDGTDYAASKAVRVTVTALTPDSALADVYWQRVTKGGSVMGDGAEYYFASRQQDGSWRLNGHLDQQLALYRGPR